MNADVSIPIEGMKDCDTQKKNDARIKTKLTRKRERQLSFHVRNFTLQILIEPTFILAHRQQQKKWRTRIRDANWIHKLGTLFAS